MKPAPVVVVAVFRAREGKSEELVRLLEGMLHPTRLEPGCERYDLHRSIDDPSLLFFDEMWTTEEDHRRHLGTAHVRELLVASREFLAGPIDEYRGRSVDG